MHQKDAILTPQKSINKVKTVLEPIMLKLGKKISIASILHKNHQKSTSKLKRRQIRSKKRRRKPERISSRLEKENSSIIKQRLLELDEIDPSSQSRDKSFIRFSKAWNVRRGVKRASGFNHLQKIKLISERPVQKEISKKKAIPRAVSAAITRKGPVSSQVVINSPRKLQKRPLSSAAIKYQKSRSMKSRVVARPSSGFRILRTQHGSHISTNLIEIQIKDKSSKSPKKTENRVKKAKKVEKQKQKSKKNKEKNQNLTKSKVIDPGVIFRNMSLKAKIGAPSTHLPLNNNNLTQIFQTEEEKESVTSKASNLHKGLRIKKRAQTCDPDLEKNNRKILRRGSSRTRTKLAFFMKEEYMRQKFNSLVESGRKNDTSGGFMTSVDITTEPAAKKVRVDDQTASNGKFTPSEHYRKKFDFLRDLPETTKNTKSTRNMETDEAAGEGEGVSNPNNPPKHEQTLQQKILSSIKNKLTEMSVTASEYQKKGIKSHHTAYQYQYYQKSESSKKFFKKIYNAKKWSTLLQNNKKSRVHSKKPVLLPYQNSEVYKRVVPWSHAQDGYSGGHKTSSQSYEPLRSGRDARRSSKTFLTVVEGNPPRIEEIYYGPDKYITKTDRSESRKPRSQPRTSNTSQKRGILKKPKIDFQLKKTPKELNFDPKKEDSFIKRLRNTRESRRRARVKRKSNFVENLKQREEINNRKSSLSEPYKRKIVRTFFKNNRFQLNFDKKSQLKRGLSEGRNLFKLGENGRSGAWSGLEKGFIIENEFQFGVLGKKNQIEPRPKMDDFKRLMMYFSHNCEGLDIAEPEILI